jgi:hypothetical protein
MIYKQVTIGYVVAAWIAMGKPPLDPREPDEVTAIRNTALVADKSQLEMPIHIGEPLLQFIESQSWNNLQQTQSSSSGEPRTDKSSKPRLSLVTLDD